MFKGIFSAQNYIIINGRKASYPSFTTRLCASLVDMLLFMILIIPMTQLINNMLLGPENAEYLNQAQQRVYYDLSGIKQNPDNAKIAQQMFSQLLSDPHMKSQLMYINLINLGLFGSFMLALAYFLPISPGGWVFGMSIVDYQSKEKATTTQRKKRAMAMILSILPLGIGILSAQFHKEKRTWHDKISRTLVVKIGKKASQQEIELLNSKNNK